MTSTKLRIDAILSGDSVLLGLLGNPSSEPYNIYYKWPKVKSITTTLPCIVFGIETRNFDQSFDRSVIAGIYNLEFNCWAKNSDYEDIAERIMFLLHQKPDSTGGFVAILDTGPQEVYDPELNIYGHNITFNLYYRRSII